MCEAIFACLKSTGSRTSKRPEILPLPPQFRGEEQGWYQGMILFENSVALVLNPAWVLEECAVSTGLGLETSQAGSSLVPFRGQL